MVSEKPALPTPRHGRTTRLWHWINVIVITTMLMSGLTIFNAHPRLYWGKSGTWGDPAWFQIGASGGRGLTLIGPVMIETTGVLGRWQDKQDKVQERAFPDWITVPAAYDLAAGRRWHFLFAWIFALGWGVMVTRSFMTGHARRDLVPQWKDLHPRAVWDDVRAHLRLRFDQGGTYNPMQKISYAGVLFVLLPLMILTGLAMSPGIDAAFHWLPEMFGGRQSARSVHFIVMSLLILFVLVHLVMVVLAGPRRLIGEMITGGQREPVVKGKGTDHDQPD
jgi:thiosulfate reductase cytochrome b subunit